MEVTQFNQEMNIISQLSDTPELSASDLKAKFDEAGELIKEYINETLVPNINKSSRDLENFVSGIAQSIPAVENSLASLSTSNALSAKTGKELNDKITQNTADINGLSESIASLESLLSQNQNRISFGTAEPTGGENGDIYIKY